MENSKDLLVAAFFNSLLMLQAKLFPKLSRIVNRPIKIFHRVFVMRRLIHTSDAQEERLGVLAIFEDVWLTLLSFVEAIDAEHDSGGVVLLATNL